MSSGISILSSIISIIMLVLVILWLYSEIWIAKDCNNKKIQSPLWLILNVLLPFIGLFLYKLTTNKN